ncbi:MAG: hypothetical protein ACM3XM_01840 [Mycobacterium leprae]
MKSRNWIACFLVCTLLALGTGSIAQAEPQQQPPARTQQPRQQQQPKRQPPPPPTSAARRAYWRALGIKTARLQLRTLSATTQQPIPGAGCVVAETRDRIETDAHGYGPVMYEPVFRNPRLEQLMAELHGQLTVICYKKGYRDAVYAGVRMHPGVIAKTDVWMYPVGYGDKRIEPTLYQVPIHRLWLISLTDKYRLTPEEGEGAESPNLTRPTEGVAPQEPLGEGVETPIRPGPIVQPPTPGTSQPAPR